VAEVACLFADAGLVAVVAIISPYASARAKARQVHADAGLPFVEVYLAATAEECARRDPKGLYAAASTGGIESFTGVDDPYEVPEAPDLVIDPGMSVPEAVDLVLHTLRAVGVPTVDSGRSPAAHGHRPGRPGITGVGPVCAPRIAGK